MSAVGPKRTSPVAPHMSAFGGKADIAFCGISLSRSLLGVKRTCLFALHMSAFDPKRTSAAALRKNTGESAFWISSTRAAQFTIKNMGTLISKTTEQTLGIDVSPHLFRMAAATTAAVYGTSTPYLASGVLGHRDERITEEHYNRARSLHVSSILSEIIEACKSSG